MGEKHLVKTSLKLIVCLRNVLQEVIIVKHKLPLVFYCIGTQFFIINFLSMKSCAKRAGFLCLSSLDGSGSLLVQQVVFDLSYFLVFFSGMAKKTW